MVSTSVCPPLSAPCAWVCVDKPTDSPSDPDLAVISFAPVTFSVTCSVPVIVVLPSMFTISSNASIVTLPSVDILIVVPELCNKLIVFSFGFKVNV